jgi:hypothetical protein
LIYRTVIVEFVFGIKRQCPRIGRPSTDQNVRDQCRVAASVLAYDEPAGTILNSHRKPADEGIVGNDASDESLKQTVHVQHERERRRPSGGIEIPYGMTAEEQKCPVICRAIMNVPSVAHEFTARK